MRTQSEDTDPHAEGVQLELLRKATVAKRVAIALSLSNTVIALAEKMSVIMTADYLEARVRRPGRDSSQ